MVRRVLVFLLILSASLAFSQPSPVPSNESTICLTAGEWDELEAQIQAELETAVTEAVNEAVKPYVIVVKKMEREILWWKIGCGTAAAVALASLIFAAVR